MTDLVPLAAGLLLFIGLALGAAMAIDIWINREEDR